LNPQPSIQTRAVPKPLESVSERSHIRSPREKIMDKMNLEQESMPIVHLEIAKSSGNSNPQSIQHTRVPLPRPNSPVFNHKDENKHDSRHNSRRSKTPEGGRNPRTPRNPISTHSTFTETAINHDEESNPVTRSTSKIQMSPQTFEHFSLDKIKRRLSLKPAEREDASRNDDSFIHGRPNTDDRDSLVDEEDDASGTRRYAKRRSMDSAATAKANTVYWWGLLQEAKIPSQYLANEAKLRETASVVRNVLREMKIKYISRVYDSKEETPNIFPMLKSKLDENTRKEFLGILMTKFRSEAAVTAKSETVFWWHVLREASIPVQHLGSEKHIRLISKKLEDMCRNRSILLENSVGRGKKTPIFKDIFFPSLSINPSIEQRDAMAKQLHDEYPKLIQGLK